MPATGLLISRRRVQAYGAGAPTGYDWCGLYGPVSMALILTNNSGGGVASCC